MKTCSSCDAILALDFYATKRGIRSECKECSRKRSRDYREANLEKCKESNRKSHAKSVPTEDQLNKRRANTRKWQANNKDKMYESCRKWREKNPSNHSQYMREWNARNPDKVRTNFLMKKFDWDVGTAVLKRVEDGVNGDSIGGKYHYKLAIIIPWEAT